MNVWQIASGEPGRGYQVLFFDYDLMLLGPSHLGNARENKYYDGHPNSSLSQVDNFVNFVSPGDRIIMRYGKEIIGVGQVPIDEDNQYSFDMDFRCVYGWELCHRRRVIWAERLELGELRNVFAKIRQKPTLTMVHETHIVEQVKNINPSYFDRELKELPKIKKGNYKFDELGIELFKAGISNRNIEEITGALQQATRLSQWYRSKDSGKDRPTENEVISHMILPLFLGLGWSHQQIAVEWNKIDMAFFKHTPTVPENCIMVLEAKGLHSALSDVLKQPIYYVESLDLKNVQYILTTDGNNLFAYKNIKDQWTPVAYLCVWSLQKEYILPKGAGAVDTLVKLQPAVV